MPAALKRRCDACCALRRPPRGRATAAGGAPGSPPARSPRRAPRLDLSAVQAMRLTPDRVSLGGVETPGDQEARGEHSPMLHEILVVRCRSR